MQQSILTALGRCAARQAVGLQLAPIREHGHLCLVEEFYFTDDAVATGKLSCAARVMAYGVACDPERKGMLQSLNGRVQGVGHVRMRGMHASETRPAASAASNSFIIRVMLTTSRIVATHRDIIHCATAGCRNALRPSVVQGAQDHVHDAL